MQCRSCGKKDLLPTFKFCPECACPLLRAENIPRKIEHGAHGVETTLPQRSAVSTRDIGNPGLDNRPIQGKFNVDLLRLYCSWLSIIQA